MSAPDELGLGSAGALVGVPNKFPGNENDAPAGAGAGGGCEFELAHWLAWSRSLAAAHFSTHLPRFSKSFGAFLSVSACIQQLDLALSGVM